MNDRYHALYQYRTALLVVISLAILALLAGCHLPWQTTPPSGGRPRTPQSPPVPIANCPIDGLLAAPEAINRRPLAVLIENSPESRPQSGLNDACVVYEAITEGGITRFLAVYLHNAPAVMGPVRSARPHFIHLAREYDAGLVHCGQSYEALQILAKTPGIINLDQMKYAKPFWRDKSRRAPHNLYGSTEKLRALMVQRRWEQPVYALPGFAGDTPMDAGAAAAQSIEINFNGAVRYRLQFVYDAQRGGYLRYMDGKLHVDRDTGEPVVAKNILIQRVKAKQYPSSKYHTFDVEVVGYGDGLFITGGRRQSMQWWKSDSTTATRYTGAGDSPLPFQRGQTWIEVVPVNGSVKIDTPAPAKRKT